MRKQYHFRAGPDGLRAWDVHRLVELTATVEPEPIPLSDVRELDAPYWSTGGAPLATREVVEHLRLVLAADLAFPIVVDPDGGVMDGMHRVARALLEGRTTIQARRLPVLPPPDHVGIDPTDLPYDD